jgi:hypothetical protein
VESRTSPLLFIKEESMAPTGRITFTAVSDFMDIGVNEKFNPKQKYYMVYGHGCKNKSDLITDKNKLKKLVSDYGGDDDWTGEIIGYELKPILRVKKTVKVEKV